MQTIYADKKEEISEDLQIKSNNTLYFLDNPASIKKSPRYYVLLKIYLNLYFLSIISFSKLPKSDFPARLNKEGWIKKKQTVAT